MALSDTDLLRPTIAHLLSSWQPALERFHSHLERLNPRLRYLLPPTLPRYVRFGLYEAASRGTVGAGPGLRRLGGRLREQGFELPDIDMLGAAWLATLEEVLGDRLAPAAREEWVRLYRLVRPSFAGLS